jgi:hypothetical protein
MESSYFECIFSVEWNSQIHQYNSTIVEIRLKPSKEDRKEMAEHHSEKFGK